LQAEIERLNAIIEKSKENRTIRLFHTKNGHWVADYKSYGFGGSTRGEAIGNAILQNTHHFDITIQNDTHQETLLDYIRRTYQVPAKIGSRVRYTGFVNGQPRIGVITGAEDAYLLVSFDNDREFRLHPTWELEYLTE